MHDYFIRRKFVLHLIIFCFLFAFYIIWLMALAPGVLGPDSLAIVWHIEKEGMFHSGKTEFWFYFVRFFYKINYLFETPIIAQLFIASLIFSRIIAWSFMNGLKFSCFLIFLFFAVAPHFIVELIKLYPDAIFSLSLASIVFELWLSKRNKKISFVSFVMIVVLFPFAAFFRLNGLVLLILFFVFFILTKDRLKWILMIFLMIWCLLWMVVDKKNTQSALYPLALYETVGFLQNRPMNLDRPKPRISAETVRVLEKYWPVENLFEYYDKDYWDPLVHIKDGPSLNRVSDDDRKLIIKEFFTYNLWNNIPSFVSSRVNIFLVSSLGDGSFVDLDLSDIIITMTNSNSNFRGFGFYELEEFLKKGYKFSENFRFFLWSPFYGIFMMFVIFFISFRSKDVLLFFVSFSMFVHLMGVFLFSIAGEYRYILPFFIFPVVALPIIESFCKNSWNNNLQ